MGNAASAEAEGEGGQTGEARAAQPHLVQGVPYAETPQAEEPRAARHARPVHVDTDTDMRVRPQSSAGIGAPTPALLRMKRANDRAQATALPFTPFRQLTGQAPVNTSNADLMMQCDAQIPTVVSTADFDMHNPAHMQVFEEEMTQMMSVAMARQARVWREKYVSNSDHRKLNSREIEVAAKGLSVPQVRQASAAATFERHELKAGRPLPLASAESPTRKAASKKMMNKAATRQFKTRNEEGQFLGQMAYHERVKSVSSKCNHAGESMAKVTIAVPNPYAAHHIRKELHYHVSECDTKAARARMLRHETEKLQAAHGARLELQKQQELARIRAGEHA